MNNLIIGSITDSIGIAISPLPIVALILMLTSKNSRKNSLFFAVGWTFSIFITLFIIVGITSIGLGAGGAQEETHLFLRTIVSLIVGVLLIVLALKSFIKWKKAKGQPEVPKWMASLDTFSTGKSLLLGVGLAVVNPKNLALLISSAVDIGSEISAVSQLVFSVVLVTFVSSAMIIIPVASSYLFKERVNEIFLRMKNWLIKYNSLIITILFFVMGVKKIILTLAAMAQ